MEILSQTEVIEQVGGWPPAVVVMMFIVILLASSFFFICVLSLNDLGIIFGLLATFFISFVSSWLWAPKEIPSGRYEYKVILDETYPATELYKEYEIVGQDGKIWIIQDKEP